MVGGLFSLSRASPQSETGRCRSRKPDLTDRTEFFGSQVGGKSVINYAYTDMPLKLLLWDLRTFFKYAYALPWVVWPIRPSDSGEFAELSPTPGNIFCLFMHSILIIWQLIFFLGIVPLCVLLPFWMTALVLVGFFAVNWLFVLTLNGSSLTYTSDPKYAPALSEHAHEKWIFINGVACGCVSPRIRIFLTLVNVLVVRLG